MKFEFDADVESFRLEVRQFLSAELTQDLVDAVDLKVGAFVEPEISLKWQALLFKRGWAAPLWPKAYGGSGWTAMQRFAFDMECGLAGAPMLAPLGLNYMGPVVIQFGSDAQKATYLPRILSGEDYWCQGFSEPGAGSDLASLRCSATRDGDLYVVNGTKMWTTHAHFANKMFCLVRTSKEEKRQRGISFLAIDLNLPGITITPIITAGGDHEVNQVFFDDVKVPADHLIGEEGDGWKIAKYLLGFERGSFIASGRLKRRANRVRDLLEQEISLQGGSHDTDAFMKTLADIEIRILALQCFELRMVRAMEGGEGPGADSIMGKLEWSELQQELDRLSAEIIGACAGYYPADPPWHAGCWSSVAGRSDLTAVMPAYLNNRATSIYGGASEIIRGMLADPVLRKSA
jgi:acyl-CoA dehydrogenase